MGDIGSRQVRFEVLPTLAQPEQNVASVETPALLDVLVPAVRERVVARAEPARS
ncbi:hypothetical protein [uncultured Jatrophihabitans sp.]|uniref:hypothetical protein n=1 Tax=uncultured Jatrophihabitans sp. TaxID=1610747 RepID=UPI0035CAA3CF